MGGDDEVDDEGDGNEECSQGSMAVTGDEEDEMQEERFNSV